ncbi:MAG: hypothetical protein ABJM29_16950 [Rhizobiaceae bacterium]
MTVTPAEISQPGQQSSLHTVIARLGTFIELETEQIQSEKNFDFGASSEKKSRLLFELNRASRGLDFSQLDRAVLTELARLKRALARNEARIKAHLSAVKEVSDLMVTILKNEEADGTYGEMI